MDRNDAQRLAHRMMVRHGLHGWGFRFDRARRRLGMCDFTDRVISLSGPLTDVNDVETVTDTILHEIAHALAGPGVGHGRQWKQIAARVGATPKACAAAGSTATLPRRWVASCPDCGRRYHRDRLTKKLRTRAYCSHCPGAPRLSWRRNTAA